MQICLLLKGNDSCIKEGERFTFGYNMFIVLKDEEVMDHPIEHLCNLPLTCSYALTAIFLV